MGDGATWPPMKCGREMPTKEIVEEQMLWKLIDRKYLLHLAIWLTL